jgi:uncharacterized protein (DUF2141 family)
MRRGAADRRGRLRASALAAGLFLVGPASAAPLIVRVEGIRSRAGSVYVGVCATALEPSACPYGQHRKARPGTETFTFQVPPGGYAIAAYHDENGDGRLDRNGVGIPTEPYGFSNDVGRLAPPTFAGARVSVGPAATTIVVRLRKFLE